MKRVIILAATILGLSLISYTASAQKVVVASPATQPQYYQPAVQAGNFLFVSGQNAQKGNEKIKGDISQQTKTALQYINQTLKAHGYHFRNVVNVNVFLAKQKDFAAFNKVYHKYFPNRPARSTSLGVLHQNKGALVEIALVAYKKTAPAT
jgi:2-iminobutanoate/2-iminopropanoate deaminase